MKLNKKQNKIKNYANNSNDKKKIKFFLVYYMY